MGAKQRQIGSVLTEKGEAMKTYVRNVEYKVPFEFCKDCRKFSPFDEGCLREDGCKEAVKLFKKYLKKGRKITDDEQQDD